MNFPYLTNGFRHESSEPLKSAAKQQQLPLEQNPRLAQKIRYKQQIAAATAQAIESASDSESDVAQALAFRIRQCCSNENTFIGSDLHDRKTGELFPGAGNFWGCGCRLCPVCVAKPSKRSAKKADYIYRNEPKVFFADWRFIVLTMPDDSLAGVSLRKHHEILHYAWRRLSTKSKFWKKKVRGAIKTEEFTISEDRADPFHYHANILAYGYWLDEKKLKTEWTKYLRLAFAKFGIDWSCETGNGLVNVRIQRVREQNRRNDERNISRAKVVLELCKYVTKSQDWKLLPAHEIAEIIKNPRFFRMFDTYGSCKTTGRRYEKEEKEKKAAAAAPAPAAPAPLSDQPDHIQQNRSSKHGESTYVHTELITAPAPALESEDQWKPPPKKRKKSWFVRLMEREIDLETYKNELIDDISGVIDYRKAQLRSKYEFAAFQTLARELF